MSGSSFDAIARAILNQQQIFEKLKEENRELRRQLAELRAGHGIFVEIGGQQIALSQLLEDAEVPPTPSTEIILPSDTQVAKTETDMAPSVVDSPTAVPTAATESLQPTDPRTRIQTPKFPKTVPVTPARQADKQDEQKTAAASNEQKAPSTFLEEMMIDEFSAAMTSPMAVWTGPAKQAEITDEEKKAALRKELMGSFLLE